MVKIINNPQSVYNGAISGQRSMFVMSSIALALFGVGNTIGNPTHTLIIKSLAICLFLLSIFIGVLTTNIYLHYLNKNSPLLKHIYLDGWRLIPYITYVYIIAICIIGWVFAASTFPSNII